MRSPDALHHVRSFVESKCPGAAAKVAECNTGWGLVATKPLRRGDTVLTVPKLECITADSVRAQRPQLEPFVPMCGDLTLIALHLVAKEWPQGYFPEVRDFPLQYESDDGCCSSRAFGVLRENALDDHVALREMGAIEEPFEDFVHALCLAMSRSFAVDGELVYAPGIDFVNHDDMLDPEEDSISWRKRPFGDPLLRLTAARDVAAGEEIMVSYGPLGAAEYLETYSFIPKRGPARRLASISELRFELDPSYPFYDDKVDVLERAGYVFYEDELPFLELGVGGEVDPELLRFLRLRHLGDQDAFLLEPVFQNELWDDFLTLPVSKPNEQAAFEAIKAECEAILYALKSPRTSPSDLHDAVRKIEVDALDVTREWCSSQLANLDTMEYYQQRRLKDLGLDTEWCADDARWTAGRAPGSVDW